MAAPSTGLPTSLHVTHPDWSPDGKNVVYVGNTAGETMGYYSHYTSSDIFVMPASGGDTPVFGASTMIHHGADASGGAEMGDADAHPTWSPDSSLVAFQHGQVAYSQFNPYGALYVTTTGAGATAVRLDNANGGVSGTSGFWPTFSPFTTTEGGVTYYWLAFFSQRDYGNVQAGTKGTSRRQLWVTAVRAGGGAAESFERALLAPWSGQHQRQRGGALGAHGVPGQCGELYGEQRVLLGELPAGARGRGRLRLPDAGEPVPRSGAALRRSGGLLRGAHLRGERVQLADQLR